MAYRPIVGQQAYILSTLGQNQICRPSGFGAEAARMLWEHKVEISKFSSPTNLMQSRLKVGREFLALDIWVRILALQPMISRTTVVHFAVNEGVTGSNPV
jgi:hypothetical protein